MTPYHTKSERDTPLLAVLRACTREEQDRIATLAGTRRNYLYSLAGCHRSPRAALAVALADAVNQVSRESGGRVPRITVQQIASMCVLKNPDVC